MNNINANAYRAMWHPASYGAQVAKETVAYKRRQEQNETRALATAVYIAVRVNP